ncbi:hypothetical protein BKA61DRAFT_709871 [Leptodontidium sp. MPI-SDFR-AT-0119]|nr:hypothetical protein BKA61DRAFT_709871 [Leptodontidium sp. MPI-SDFR-AT-0119]
MNQRSLKRGVEPRLSGSLGVISLHVVILSFRELRFPPEPFTAERISEHLERLGMVSRARESEIREHLAMGMDSKMQQEMAGSVLKRHNDLANKVVQPASSTTNVLTQPPQPITPHPRLPSAPLMPSAPNPNRHQYAIDTVTGTPSRPLQTFCNLAEWITTSSRIPKEVELSRDLGVFASLWILLTKQPGFQDRLPKSGPTDDFSPPRIMPWFQHLPLHQLEFNEPPLHVGNSPELPDIEQLFLFDSDPTFNADTMFEKIKEDFVGKGSPSAEKFRRMNPKAPEPESSSDDDYPNDLPDSRLATESTQIDILNCLINSCMAAIQGGVRPLFTATSDQKQFSFGSRKDGPDACFNAPVDGIQMGDHSKNIRKYFDL